MSWKWNNPGRHHRPAAGLPSAEPTPEEIAAWIDGELDWPDARRVESWLADHPEQAREADSLAHVVRLYRDHAPPGPSAGEWQTTLDAIENRVRPAGARRRWWPHLVLGLATAAAAAFGAVAVTRALAPETPTAPAPVQTAQRPLNQDQADDEFPVASASEVHIINVNADDADRLALHGSPLMGSFELPAPEEIEVLQIVPPLRQRTRAEMKRDRVPMIVATQLSDDDEP